MFNFFKKSKKDDRKAREKKENNKQSKCSNTTHQKESANNNCSTDDKGNMCKNNQPSTPELAPDSDAIPMPKNLVNAVKTIGGETEVVFSEKINELNDTNMSDPCVKVPETSNAKLVQRRGSCVKPCGHGTTAIAPRVPIQTIRNIESVTPPTSPVMEVRKSLKFTVGTIKENPKENLQEQKVDKDSHDGINAEDHFEETKKNLINQEAKFQSQLNDLSKQLSVRDAEANNLRFQMEELQRDVFAKSAGVDRLQAELNATTKQSELIRQKIRHLETELENYRKRNTELVEELQNKSDAYDNYETETQSKIYELEKVIQELRNRIETLEGQIKELTDEKEKLEARHIELQGERDEESKRLAETLENAIKQKEEIEKKWKEDFEKLRTVNIMKEQELLDDFEWKLREVQQICKKKLVDKDKTIEEKLQEAYKQAEQKMEEANKMLSQVKSLKSYETEVQHLRGQTSEQERTLEQMREQQAQMIQAETNLKSETKRLLNLIELEKENLQHIQRLHRQEMLDKERKLKETLNQKRIEIAMYWEEKLMHECNRLKDEMEQIHNEEKYVAMEMVRKEKEEEFQKKQIEWEKKLMECLKEIESLKKALNLKDEYYHEELINVRSKTDRDILELRRLMDKIDMTHHDNYDKLVEQHEIELEKIKEEHEDELKLLENTWRSKVNDLSINLEKVKQEMEIDAQKQVEVLIHQHRKDLDSQWQNLIQQKDEATQLVEDEYVSKYKTLEDQFYIQQKSHSAREIELLKTIDILKNELQSKLSTVDDLQNNVDTLEGGIQVLNQEIAQHTDDLNKMKREAGEKIKNLTDTVTRLLEERDKEQDNFRNKLMGCQKQNQETIDHLQRKCNCLTKLFEEVRQRYERRESRQEDLNIISDLRQVIAEQEKDLACINEEKRYFQMRLIQLERHLEQQSSAEDEQFEDAQPLRGEISPTCNENLSRQSDQIRPHFLPPNLVNQNLLSSPAQNAPIFIPPTISEEDE